MFDMAVNSHPYGSICLGNNWNVKETAFDKYLDALVINLIFIHFSKASYFQEANAVL